MKASTILRKRLIFSNRKKKLLRMWKNSTNTQHPQVLATIQGFIATAVLVLFNYFSILSNQEASKLRDSV